MRPAGPSGSHARVPLVRGCSFFGVLALALPLAGCYSGEASGIVALRDYAVDGFVAVAVSSDGGVRIVPGEHGVSVSGETNVLPTVQVERRGDTLYLGRAVDWIDGVRPTVSIEYRVSMPVLERLQVSGPGTVAVLGMKSNKALTLDIAGGGQVDLVDVAAAEVDLTARAASVVSATGLRAPLVRCVVGGSGRVALDGEADTLVLEASGSSLYRGSHLRAATVQAELNGAGQALVWAQERLEAQVGGRSRLRYRGDPTVDGKVVRGGSMQPLTATEP